MGTNPAAPTWPCGGVGQKPCPPENGVTSPEGAKLWTEEQVHQYGENCFQAGHAHALASVRRRPTGALEAPSMGNVPYPGEPTAPAPKPHKGKAAEERE
jgi:hypothetical protein